MKILVLSLLRLGDILLHKQVIKSLNETYPGASVDFAINDSFASCRDLIGEVNQIHLLPRTALQRILVEQEQTSLAAFEILAQFADKINNENYDLILDATHNRLSVKLCAILVAKEIRFAKNKETKQNLWEVYFNTQFSQVNQSRFHYVEVLTKSLGLNSPEVLRPRKTQSQKVVFQVLTSDIKKNWGLSNFKAVIDRLEGFECVIVCAPNEKSEIDEFFSGNQYDVRSLGLLEVKQELQTAALLVSGDTSIQHLAAEVGCPIVSVFIGSADAKKTAPFIKNTNVIQASSDCYPCKHSEACYQKSHLCAETVTVNEVYRSIQTALKGDLMSPDSGTQTFNTDSDRHGFFIRATNNSVENLALDFERIIWSFYLSNDWRAPVPAYGSTVYEVLSDWTNRYSMKSISQFAAKYQVKVLKLENLINDGKNYFSQISKGCLSGDHKVDSITPMIDRLKAWHSDAVNAFPEHSDSFLKLKFALHKDYLDTFSLYRELKSSLDEPLNLNLIRKQILINLVRSLSEKGELYGRELGILS